ncbi:MAG: CHAT domain-containing protein [Blastocatellia bacterium]
MVQESDETIIRKHLLGKLTEEELSRAEERLLADDDYFELLTALEEELMDDYISGDLTEEERARFDAYFLSTPERREKFRFAQTLKAYIPRPVLDDNVINLPVPPRPPWWKPLLSSPYLGLAAAAMLVIAIVLLIPIIIPPGPENSKGLEALNKAYSLQRPVESRITGFGYAPPPPVTRGGGQERFDYVARDRAQALILVEAEDHPDARSYHDLGRLYLTQHEFDKAIDQFEKALALDDKSAQLHSDYGAAWMEKGKAARLKDEGGNSLEYFARALEQFNKAIDMDGSLLETLFNRALCLQYMDLPQRAAEAWQNYLQKDGSSKWSVEANQKLKEIEEQKQKSSQNRQQQLQDFLDAYKAGDDEKAWQAICQNRDVTGSFVENYLIDNYLDSAIEGRGDQANQAISALSYASHLEQQRAGDQFVPGLLQFYKSATPAQQTALAQARHLMKSGHDNYKASNYEEAIKFYTRARDIFNSVGDVCGATYINYPLSYAYLLQAKPESSLPILQELIKTCEKFQYRWLLARCCTQMASAQVGFRDLSMAVINSNRSLEISKNMGDTNGVMGSLLQLGAEYLYLNNYQKSISLHAQSLALARASSSGPRQLWPYYFSIGNLFSLIGLYDAAIAFQKEALQLAIEAETPELIARSYNYMGLVYGNQNNYAEATRNIQLAVDIAKSFSDKTVRLESMAYSFLQLGDVYSKTGEFNKAIEGYDQANDLYEQLNYTAFSYFTRKGKLMCCIAQGECPSVEQEIETTLELFEKHRTKILEESNRNIYFDAEQNIYDVAIDFEFSKRKDFQKAFDYSETCRARSLRDLINTNVKIVDDPVSPDVVFDAVSLPLNVNEIQKRMPEQAQILQYAVLKDRLLIWVVSRDKFFGASQDISMEDLSRIVRSYLKLISNPSENDAEASSQEAVHLYNILIKPVESLLDKNRQLCIVPDKIVNYIPFGALISADSGSYFIEDYNFVLSPSSNTFILCSDAAREKERAKQERILCVGNPRFDTNRFPPLDALPSAVHEAEEIAKYYDSSVSVTENAATKRRVIEEIEKSEVVHLALHAVVNESSPMRSQLLLAKTAGSRSGRESEEVLQAYELYKLNLARAKLVVLSACQTGVERYYGGEGMIGISRPFIARRVPLVVASLWPVNSDSAAKLMIDFHKYRKNPKLAPTTTEALRSAQLDMLRGADNRYRLPYHWASFVAIGGYARF